ncbi:HalOD1 output domain-containing protein [Salinigranum salinum]|uniref:HalOD1 output domain-containing protein n=1 Tax=Salinigranum salinum TaxID=1364937 RepID=UPI00126074DA|nr:HalOD1 output domain-containing protein [Salinigranum salinum]
MSSNRAHTTPSVSVVNAVAAAKGVPPVNLDPLVKYVDLESLDDLLANSADEVRITCIIDGMEVVVEADGHASVSPETTD